MAGPAFSSGMVKPVHHNGPRLVVSSLGRTRVWAPGCAGSGDDWKADPVALYRTRDGGRVQSESAFFPPSHELPAGRASLLHVE